jgi:RNA polymerase sigma-70 factor (ECF subfamily)
VDLSERSRRPGTAQGDLDFDRFVEREYKVLLRQAYALTGDAQESQDLVQETLLRAWRRWSRVSRLDAPGAWARRVLHNLAVSSWRRAVTRSRHRERYRSSHDDAPGTGHLDVAAAVRALPDNQRMALVLRTMVDMSSAEIAAELGTTEATVRSWLTRARKSVANELGLTEALRPGQGDAARGVHRKR